MQPHPGYRSTVSYVLISALFSMAACYCNPKKSDRRQQQTQAPELFAGQPQLPASTEISTAHPGKDGSSQKAAEGTALAPPVVAEKTWIAKTARALRSGRRISAEELAKLEGKKPDEIMNQFLDDEDFLLTLLDFNMYFIGYKGDSLYTSNYNQNFDSRIFNFPQALDSALQFSENGDYLRLFDFHHDFIVPPLGKAISYISLSALKFLGKSQEQLEAMTSSELRTLYLTSIESIILSAKKDAQAGNATAACTDLLAKGSEGSTPIISSLLGSLGIPDILIDEIVITFSNIEDQCDPQTLTNTPINSLTSLIVDLDGLFFDMKSLVQKLPEVTDARPKLKHLTRSVPHKSKDLLNANTTDTLNTAFFSDYINSSTNGNRRRAAYILRTYFCDNLVPVNVINTTEHTQGNKHASDPNCISCHYKLDPMAGFFKNRGVAGLDFENPETVKYIAPFLGLEANTFNFMFDDLTTLNAQQMQDYYNNWKSSEAGRPWNIGYIRSSTNSAANSYGESLEDLFKIIRKAPEARQCLVQRLAEYFIGANLTFDLGWLQAITKEMDKEANSSQGLRKAIKLVVNSNAFRSQNPLPDQCYDFPAETSGSQDKRPPCEVNAILQQNCNSCHSTSSPAAGLDLSSWRQTGDNEFGFNHVNAVDKTFVAPCASFEIIKQRLSSTSLAQAMPPGGNIPTSQKEKLYLWLNKQTSNCQK